MSHTGWAGNTVWIDPAQQRFVIVLAHRLDPNQETAIRLRTRIADLALQSCE